MEQQKKKTNLRAYLWTAALVVIGLVCGFAFPHLFDLSFMQPLGEVELFLTYAVIILLVWLAYMTQVVLHETGHLLGGLLSGYRFSSFRIGKNMLVRIDGKLALRRFSIAGTGGQCLMIPKEGSGVVLFHLGGALLNLLSGGIMLALWLLLSLPFWVALFFAANALFGILFALLNGIPLRTGLIANDGSNMLALKRDSAAAEQFSNHLKMNAMSVDGARLLEMPDAWFAFPTDEQLKNNAYAETAVFACNRLLDEHRFAEAEERITYLLHADSVITGVHRRLLICDLIYCEAIGACRNEVFVKWMDREQLNFIRSMREFPSVVRTEYAYTRLLQRAPLRAGVIKKRFEKCIATYPNRGEISTERDLIRIADQIEVDVEDEE